MRDGKISYICDANSCFCVLSSVCPVFIGLWVSKAAHEQSKSVRHCSNLAQHWLLYKQTSGRNCPHIDKCVMAHSEPQEAKDMSATDQYCNGSTKKFGKGGAPEIIDIRRSRIQASVKDEIRAGLGKEEGQKYLPLLLLYGESGLKIFEEITQFEDYYPAAAEIEILEKYVEEMAERIDDDSILVELGSG